MKVIGIAGPAGSGKSTVARLLAERPGFARLDCDELAWATYRPQGPAHAALVARFGRGILDQDGTVDRARLSAATFADPPRKKDLEAIVHPEVMAAVQRAITEHRALGTQVLLVEGALLLSSPHVDRSIFDTFVWLSVPEAERRKRLLGSGLEREVVERRLCAQQDLAPPKEPRVRVVDGRGPPGEVASRVLALLDSLGGC
ncbi:MAG: dephospho-CoA kinase [Candidatus Bipolaricaulota bacterium]